MFFVHSASEAGRARSSDLKRIPWEGTRFNMNLLLYSSMPEGSGERLEKAVGSLVPNERFRIHRTVGELFQGLRQPGNAPAIAILQVADKRDLQDLIFVRDYLGEARLILILPDMEEETVARAHQLRPRVLMKRSSDCSEILAVLEKMMGGGGGA